MELIKVDNLNSTGDNYLRISELTEGIVYEKVALVSSAGAGLARTNTGFAKFYLKDANACVCAAFLFDVENFAVSGLKLTQFRGCPVLVKFVAHEYNGSMSLVIDGKAGIRAWDGEFDRKKFVGEVEFDEKRIIDFGRRVISADFKLPPEWRLLSSFNIGSGKVGAFMKALEMTVASIESEQSLLGDDWKLAGRIVFVVAHAIYSVELVKQTAGVLEDTKIFDFIMATHSKYREDEYYAVILDAVKAAVRLQPPKHLISHLVLKSFNQAIEVVNLVDRNNALIYGASTDVGGALLLKF